MEFLDLGRDFATVYSSTLNYRYIQDDKFFNSAKVRVNPDSGDVLDVPEEVVTAPVVLDEDVVEKDLEVAVAQILTEERFKLMESVEGEMTNPLVGKVEEKKTISDVAVRGRPSKRK